MKPVHLEVTMMKIIGELKAENARLKAEVERLNDAIMRGASVPDAYPEDKDQP